MREVKLINNIEYNHKYKKNEDGTLNGNNYICSNLSLSKTCYTANELVTLNTKQKEVAKRIAKKYKKTFDDRGGATKEQLDFAKETAKIVAGDLKEDIITVIPAPCGFGKSSITEEILKTRIEDIKNKLTTDGIIIVTNKLDALKEANNNLEEGYGYVLEGWNEEICNNKDAKKSSNKACNPTECPNYYNCKIFKQHREQKEYPILFLTNARLKDCKENINIYNEYNKGKRTLLLIDERPEIAETIKINTELLNNIDTALSKCNYLSIEDGELLRKKWSTIKNKFEEDIFGNYRSRYNRFIVSRKTNELICKSDKIFMCLWDKYMKNDFKNELDHINKALTEGGLYVNCLNDKYYSSKRKSNEFIATIGYRNLKELYCKNFKTIIFDGTALYDNNYANLEDEGDLKFLFIENPRIYNNLNVNVYEQHRLSKFSFNEKKYLINGIADFIKNKCGQCFEDVFVVTYKERANQLGQKIKNSNVIKYEDDTLFYFGNTKGSNAMSSCTKMFQLGWETMPDYEYAINFLCTCTKFSKVLDLCLNLKKAENLSEKLEYKERIDNDGVYTSQFKKKKFGLDRLENFKRFDTVVKFYQEVHRTKLRDYNFNKDIEVNLFKNEKIIFDMIKNMFPDCHIKYMNEEIHEFKIAKVKNRKAKSGKENTVPQILLSYIEGLDNGKIVKMSDLIEGSGLSREQIKEVKKNNELCKVWFKEHSLKSINGKANGKYII